MAASWLEKETARVEKRERLATIVVVVSLLFAFMCLFVGMNPPRCDRAREPSAPAPCYVLNATGAPNVVLHLPRDLAPDFASLCTVRVMC